MSPWFTNLVIVFMFFAQSGNSHRVTLCDFANARWSNMIKHRKQWRKSMSQGKTSIIAHVEHALFLLILNVLLMNFLNGGTGSVKDTRHQGFTCMRLQCCICSLVCSLVCKTSVMCTSCHFDSTDGLIIGKTCDHALSHAMGLLHLPISDASSFWCWWWKLSKCVNAHGLIWIEKNMSSASRKECIFALLKNACNG